jgi:hypothetical protein
LLFVEVNSRRPSADHSNGAWLDLVTRWCPLPDGRIVHSS